MKLVLLAVASFAASAQTPPAFEVATVKPSDPAAVMSIRRSGHRIITTGTTLEFLIKWAFDLQTDRIVGRPPWLGSDRFDVVGASPMDEDEPQTRPGEPTLIQRRMQTLLADRFSLKTHRETREMAIYAVTVAKGGFKPALSPEPEVFGQQPFRSAGWSGPRSPSGCSRRCCRTSSGARHRTTPVSAASSTSSSTGPRTA
jgi:uncharacterized protein (TIGR03435 family)